MSERAMKSVEVDMLICDSCGDWVPPKHPETLDEMHNTDCAECNDGLLQHQHEEVLRVSEFRDLLDRIRDADDKNYIDESHEQRGEGWNAAIKRIENSLNSEGGE